ncbi:tumor necrosis factor receptor superfamily member EDAR-like [Petromyzon marinus]|uniref:Tumor necrosis factor receptor superfamily member EDAR-like n=1 Tax=Petromyzon marinus TaxID=7757 RepID=A0AAJ7X5W7_PETMA|nr:tumor necrosis factor receptor superfamily member EDAR-like [Petromyzon marinus]XP_032822693.1 tumor necrosis factor receptor superfamily member EDAR-like [Petromyzon marinus]XP_032822694.1 tumor necrosis factor receptor superfamily member EDAR-like [Petromyzon marinus]
MESYGEARPPRSRGSLGCAPCRAVRPHAASVAAGVLGLLALGTLVTCVAARAPMCGEHQFLSNGLCQPCRQCPPGEEPNQVCGYDYGEGTTCAACPAGYYSDKLGYGKCQPHVDCELYNAKTQQAGNKQRDSVCGECLPGFYHCSLLSPDSSNKYDKNECCDCRSAKTKYPECGDGRTTANVRIPHAVPTSSHEHVRPLFYMLLGVLLLFAILVVWVVCGPRRRATCRLLNPVASWCHRISSGWRATSATQVTNPLLPTERKETSRDSQYSPSEEATFDPAGQLCMSGQQQLLHQRRHSTFPRVCDKLKNCKCEQCQDLFNSLKSGHSQHNANRKSATSDKKNAHTSGVQKVKGPNLVKDDSDSDENRQKNPGQDPWMKAVPRKDPSVIGYRSASVGPSLLPTVPIKPEGPTRTRLIERVEDLYRRALKKTKDMAIDSLDFRLRERLTLKLNSSLNASSGGSQQNLLSKLAHRLGITSDEALLLGNAEELLRVASTRAASVPSLLEALYDVKHYDVLNLLCEGLLSPYEGHHLSYV